MKTIPIAWEITYHELRIIQTGSDIVYNLTYSMHTPAAIKTEFELGVLRKEEPVICVALCLKNMLKIIKKYVTNFFSLIMPFKNFPSVKNTTWKLYCNIVLLTAEKNLQYKTSL